MERAPLKRNVHRLLARTVRERSKNWMGQRGNWFLRFLYCTSLCCKGKILILLFIPAQIPLAKKLKDCGVFGVSSDEYLNYAMINRRKWAEEGDEITAAMVSRLDEPEYDNITKSTVDSIAMDLIIEDHPVEIPDSAQRNDEIELDV